MIHGHFSASNHMKEAACRDKDSNRAQTLQYAVPCDATRGKNSDATKCRYKFMIVGPGGRMEARFNQKAFTRRGAV